MKGNIEMYRMKRLGMTLAAVFVMVLMVGCSSKKFVDNEGININSKPGEPIRAAWLMGDDTKWDLDGERTNTANGRGGILDIPSDIIKDVLGKGWRFLPRGTLLADGTLKSKPGEWKLDGNLLTVREYGQPKGITYKAHFRDGFLYLEKPDGKWMVFERNKFFGQ